MPKRLSKVGLEDSVNKVWGESGWFKDILRASVDNEEFYPCYGKSFIYDASEASPIARRAAAIICSDCPIRNDCARAGRDSGYYGVWGGRFRGADEILPLDVQTVTRWIKYVQKTSSTEDLIKNFGRGIPMFLDLLKEKRIQTAFEDECLIIARINPKLAISLRREITNQALLLGSDTYGTARIELTCNNFAYCISPWHMRWSADRPIFPLDKSIAGSRNIALALYLTLRESWFDARAAEVACLDKSWVGYLRRTAKIVGLDTEFVYGSAGDITTWLRIYWDKTSRKGRLNPQYISAILTLSRVSQELSCRTMNEILDVGKEEY